MDMGELNSQDLTIGILGYEYFGFKKSRTNEPTSSHGGFGFLTKQKAEYLANIGINVHVFLPSSAYDRENNENWETEENGVSLHFYKSPDKMSENFFENIYGKFAQHWVRNINLDNMLKSIRVDIFQSEEPGLFTLQSMKYSKKQVVVFQNPYDREDFKIMERAEREYLSCLDNKIPANGDKFNRLKLRLAMSSRNYVKKILQLIPKEYIYAEANFISEKVKKMYDLDFYPKYLPNPYHIGTLNYTKSSTPAVVWIGRFDPQKRPDIALYTASKMPDIDFYFIGKSTEYKPYRDIEAGLKSKFSKYDNIHFKEFVTEEEKFEILGKSWILLNSSVREGLPVSFLEAMKTKTCLVASVDPDQYTTNFGIKVQYNNYGEAIREALNNKLYMEKGERGFSHLTQVHEISKVMDKHLDIYRSLVK